MRLSYELAKKLKEAGFVCKGTEKFEYVDKENNPCGFNREGAVRVPTLEELIEAIWKGKNIVTFGTVKKDGTGWYARLWHSSVFDDYTEELGKTPLEAVANLFIKLNENKHGMDRRKNKGSD